MADFTLFPKLPAEIRHQIWELCLPCRIFEADPLFIPDDIKPVCSLDWPILQSRKPPVLTRI